MPEQPVEEDAEQPVQQRLGQRAEQQQPAPPPLATQPGLGLASLRAPENKKEYNIQAGDGH